MEKLGSLESHQKVLLDRKTENERRKEKVQAALSAKTVQLAELQQKQEKTTKDRHEFRFDYYFVSFSCDS